MHIEVEQQVDFKLVREFDAALYCLDSHPALRFRPIVGIALMGVTVWWMLTHSPDGAASLAIAFVFFWGAQLAGVWFVKRGWMLARLARALLPGGVEVVRLDSLGASRSSDRQLLQLVRWSRVEQVMFFERGVLIDAKEAAPIFVSARSLTGQALNELKAFLQREWPDRIRGGV